MNADPSDTETPELLAFTCECGVAGQVSLEDPTGLDVLAPGALSSRWVYPAEGERYLVTNCPHCCRTIKLQETT